MFWWVLLLLGSISFFLILQIVVFPKFILEGKYTIGQTFDRGIKKYKTRQNEEGIVFEPALAVRRHIKQYVLSAKGGKKLLKCKIRSDIRYISYDVVLFNQYDTVFKVLTVQDIISEDGFTKEVELPADTSYVTLILKEVDRLKFPKLFCAKIPPAKLTLYCILTMLSAAGTAYLINLSFSYLFGGLFRESYASSVTENVLVISIALVASVIGTVLLSFILTLRNKKK